MKYHTKTRSLLVLLVMFFAYACQPSKTEETASNEEEEVAVETTVEEVKEATAGVINPNLASLEEIMTAGISETLANTIIENRPFLDMVTLNDLLSADLDSAQLSAVYASLFVPLNLNTTPEDNFKIIPGVGDRMAHEFEEYRPYIKVEQFRKEIGKYVDEEEVARYEQYVFVPVELNTASKEEILAIPGVGDRMLHEFEEYRPYTSMEQFRKEIGKYVDEKELSRLERFVYLGEK